MTGLPFKHSPNSGENHYFHVAKLAKFPPTAAVLGMTYSVRLAQPYLRSFRRFDLIKTSVVPTLIRKHTDTNPTVQSTNPNRISYTFGGIESSSNKHEAKSTSKILQLNIKLFKHNHEQMTKQENTIDYNKCQYSFFDQFVLLSLIYQSP
jgi:hypothetical protein